MSGRQTMTTRDVAIPINGTRLTATLDLPADARGLVIFAHGSGSSRHSPRNRAVAGRLQRAGLATLLLDLLTTEEEFFDSRTASLRFDIPLLARRLGGATDWAQQNAALAHLPIVYFGASTGAAAALMAAADRSDVVRAVVSRGGRPELAADVLPKVVAPTLLIVGGADVVTQTLTEPAFETLREHTEARLDIISGASHLFEEPGALEIVGDLATDWFLEHLAAEPVAQPIGAGIRSTNRR